MIHLKEYNSFNIKNEIEEYTKECFVDFISIYGLESNFQYGQYSKVNSFIHQSIYDKILPDIRHRNVQFYDSCKISFINRRDKPGKLEIHVDNESNAEFTNSAHQLEQILKENFNIKLFDYPKVLLSTWHQINIIICWE